VCACFHRPGQLVHQDRYQVIELREQGTFCWIFDAIDKKNKDLPVVLKVVDETVSLERAKNEIDILQCLADVPNVVRLLDHFMLPSDHLCLVLEKLECNLRQFLVKRGCRGKELRASTLCICIYVFV